MHHCTVANVIQLRFTRRSGLRHYRKPRAVTAGTSSGRRSTTSRTPGLKNASAIRCCLPFGFLNFLQESRTLCPVAARKLVFRDLRGKSVQGRWACANEESFYADESPCRAIIGYLIRLFKEGALFAPAESRWCASMIRTTQWIWKWGRFCLVYLT